MPRSLLVGSALSAVLLLAGCIVHGRHGARVIIPGHIGVVVRLPAAHVCSDDCGHYRYRGEWYHAHGHRHGPGCGHRFHGGIWIIGD